MADEQTIKHSKTSGFYYDIQMSNPLLTATLHTNTYIESVGPANSESSEKPKPGLDPYELPGKFNWVLWKRTNNSETDSSNDKPSEGKVFCLDPITHNYSYAYDENPSACYRAKPLITAILSEDFQVEAGNMWNDAGGANQIESTFNNMRAMSAPLQKETGGLLGALSKEISNHVNENGILGKMNKVLGSVANSMKTNGADTLNSALISQGTRFTYYGGTSTTFGNLNMRFTLFADWVFEDGFYKFKTVHDQLREIYPYAVGKYYPLDLDLGNKARQRGYGETIATAGDKVSEAVSSFFGWQQPPAGFQADVRSLDTCQKGTLRLVLGGYYTAENLVISGMSVNFSKTMTKIPPRVYTDNVRVSKPDYEETAKIKVIDPITGETKEVEKTGLYGGMSKGQEIDSDNHVTGFGELTPLYADVTISLKPATSYSDTAIINFSSNMGRGKFNYDMARMRNSALQKEIEKKREKSETDRLRKKRKEEEADAYMKEVYGDMSEEEINSMIDQLEMDEKVYEENLQLNRLQKNQSASYYNNGETVMWTKDGDLYGNSD